MEFKNGNKGQTWPNDLYLVPSDEAGLISSQKNHSLGHDQGLVCGCHTTAAWAKGRRVSLQADPTGRRDSHFWICCQPFFSVTVYTLFKMALCPAKHPEGEWGKMYLGLSQVWPQFWNIWRKTGNFSAKTKNRADMTHSCKTVNGTEKVITE